MISIDEKSTIKTKGFCFISLVISSTILFAVNLPYSVKIKA